MKTNYSVWLLILSLSTLCGTGVLLDMSSGSARQCLQHGSYPHPYSRDDRQVQARSRHSVRIKPCFSNVGLDFRVSKKVLLAYQSPPPPALTCSNGRQVQIDSPQFNLFAQLLSNNVVSLYPSISSASLPQLCRNANEGNPHRGQVVEVSEQTSSLRSSCASRTSTKCLESILQGL